jgi:hypothetical protein
VIKSIQITTEVAEDVAKSLRATDDEAERRRMNDLRQIEQRRTAAAAKLDRGYKDFVSGRISEEFWTRKSQGNVPEEGLPFLAGTGWCGTTASHILNSG